MKKNKKDKGLTLIELIIVLLVIAILIGISVPIYQYFLKKAKQVEAQIALKEISKLESIYFGDHDKFSSSLSEIGFSPMHPLQYYTNITIDLFPGNKFVAKAEGNIDRDPDLDVWIINETGIITHLAED